MEHNACATVEHIISGMYTNCISHSFCVCVCYVMFYICFNPIQFNFDIDCAIKLCGHQSKIILDVWHTCISTEMIISMHTIELRPNTLNSLIIFVYSSTDESSLHTHPKKTDFLRVRNVGIIITLFPSEMRSLWSAAM